MKFLAILDQLNEIDGEFDQAQEISQIDRASGGKKMSELEGQDADIMMEDAREVNKKAGKQREPAVTSIELNEKTGTLTLESTNVRFVEIKYYMINAELMFSRAPFLKDSAEGFSYVMPFETIRKEMMTELEVENHAGTIVRKTQLIPEALKNQNVVIEILGANKQTFKTFYSNALKIQVLEAYGELKVMHAEKGTPMAKVYVKVYG